MLLVAFIPPRMYGRYLMVVYPPLAVFAGIGMGRILSSQNLLGSGLRGLSAFLEQRMPLLALTAFVLILALPFERHQSNRKVRLDKVAPLLQKAYSTSEKVPLFRPGVHAPESVIYFHCDREAVVVDNIKEAIKFDMIVTSPDYFPELKAHNYHAQVEAPKLILAVRGRPDNEK